MKQCKPFQYSGLSHGSSQVCFSQPRKEPGNEVVIFQSTKKRAWERGCVSVNLGKSLGTRLCFSQPRKDTRRLVLKKTVFLRGRVR